MTGQFMIICCLTAFFISDSCRIYLARSKIDGAGRGIFAGEQIESDTIIEYVGAITFLSEHSDKTILANYVFGVDDKDYVMLLLGSGSLYNFIPKHTSVQLFWGDEHVTSPHPGLLHYSNMTRSVFSTMFVVGDGEELYLNYGESWLSNRGWDLSFSYPPPPYTLRELQEVGVCITNVEVNQSTIEGVGQGLFAKQDLKMGELIIVSPVLFLPMDVVYDTRESSILLNYVWTEPESRVGVLPLGNVAMINHPAYLNQTNNVMFTWYDWDNNPEKLKEKLLQSVDTILGGNLSPLDIAVYATRDIAAGEELFIDYGTDWVAAWEDFESADEKVEGILFRHSLVLPSQFLPWRWKNTEERIVVEGDEEEVISEFKQLKDQDVEL